MSARKTTTTHANHLAARVALAVLCAVAAGLLALAAGDAAAQPPTSLNNDKNAPAVDTQSPVPADGPRKKPHAAYAIDTNKLMYNRIEDFKPVASEVENPQEYDAWCSVVMHAKKFTTAELEQHAARDLTVLDFQKPLRSAYRCELIRFEGKLVCIRRLPAPKFFTDNPELGITELYEARFVPLNESPLTPVSIVFLELPPALAGVKQKEPKQWMDVDTWITAAGYYFKTMSVPGNTGVGVPLLVGKSITPLPGPPVPPEAVHPAAFDKNVRLHNFIRDKAKIASRPKFTDFDAHWEEAAAYDRLVRHAARFSAEELEQHARVDLNFADIFLDESHPNYRFDLMKFEGRLISLRRFEPSAEVKAAGIDHLFEGWLVPAREPRGNPICIVFTEPLEGIDPNGRVNVWVSFAGYYFKKMRYESMEQDPKNPSKNLDKYAPLLIGKRPIQRHDPDGPSAITWAGFLQAVVVGGIILIACALGLTWWYRRGDRNTEQSIDTMRSRNPFDAVANPPTHETT